MINRFIKIISVLILLMGYASQSVAIDRDAYFVGNSLTHRIKLSSGLRDLAKERGHTFSGEKNFKDFMQIISGASLWWHWYHGAAANDYYRDTFTPDLTTNDWDTLVLQPYDGKPWHFNKSPLLENWHAWKDRPREEGDVPMSINFIDLMINKGISDSSLQVYIYSQWPKVFGATKNPDFENFDYPTSWNQGHKDTSRYNNRTRDYYEYLMHTLRSETSQLLDKEVLIIPIGDAIYELNERLRASPLVNGNTVYDDIVDVYGDGNHLSPGVMQYFKALVFFTVFYQEDPRGLSIGKYGDIDWYHSLYHSYFVEITPEWKRRIQETVWQVTATHFYAGVRETLRRGDANLDGKVNVADFNLLAAAWGRTDVDPHKTGIGWRDGDFDGNGRVDQADLELYQANIDPEVKTLEHEPPKLLIPDGLSKDNILNKTVVYGEKYIAPITVASAQGYKLSYELKQAPVEAQLDNYNHMLTWEADILGLFAFDIIIREIDAESSQKLVLKASISVEAPTLTVYGIEPENLDTLTKAEIENLPNEAFQALRQPHILQLSPEVFKSITAEQMSYMTYSALSAISVEQFLNLSPSVLGSIRASSLGGFSPDVLAKFTTTHIEALDPSIVFSQLPNKDTFKIVTHLDLNVINAKVINDLLPANWLLEGETGRLKIPAGIPLNVKTFVNHSTLPPSVNMPQFAKLEAELPLGDDANETLTLLAGMNQALAQNNLEQFSFTQDANGIVKAADDSGLQFAFIPNQASFMQEDSEAVTGLQLIQRELRIVTTEKQALSLIPAPKDITALRNILPEGEIYIGDKGVVIFDYANVKDTRNQSDDFKADVVVCEFDVVVETSADNDCDHYHEYDIYVCGADSSEGQMTQQTGRSNRDGVYQSLKGKIVYGDSTAQTIYPTIIEPAIFFTLLHQVDGIEETITYKNGAYLVKFEGNDYILQPDFTATASPLSIKGQLLAPTIHAEEGGFLEYKVVSNDIEYTQKLFIYAYPVRSTD